MKKPLMKKMFLPLVSCFAVSCLVSCNNGAAGEDEYDKDGNLKVSIRNMYFENWGASDAYTDEIKNKFKISIEPSAYSYIDWDSQVSGEVNSNTLKDVFHYNITQFNFGTTYKNWAKKKIIKPLPSDMSEYPNIKKYILDNASSLEDLKIDGKLYGLPIIKNILTPEVLYSPFTYVYRRDWAKKWGVYQENDDYTWEQFNALVDAFHQNLYIPTNGNKYAMVDVEWGYPSVTNFFKDSPHCFSFDGTKYVSSFTTDAYLQGLEFAKNWTSKKYYGYDQYQRTTEGQARNVYVGNTAGILYENLSLANYKVIRDNIAIANHDDENFNLDDATAIMKVKGPDGKYALEGTDNWYSMTLFRYNISDTKQKLVLKLLDWLLGEEGTRFAVYGIEGYDYDVDDKGGIHLREDAWPKDSTGQYAKKENGAKCLRYMATLGNDYAEFNPLTSKEAYSVLSSWDKDMAKAQQEGKLRMVMEPKEVIWLSLENKDRHESRLLEDATTDVVKYCYNSINKEAYLSAMNTSIWQKTLKEINDHFGY